MISGFQFYSAESGGIEPMAKSRFNMFLRSFQNVTNRITHRLFLIAKYIFIIYEIFY